MDKINTVEKFVNFVQNLPKETHTVYLNLDKYEWLWQSDDDPWIHPFNTDKDLTK